MPNFSKTEAIRAMVNGKKVAHYSFPDGYSIKMLDRKFVSTTGESWIPSQFWETRESDAWTWGWRTVR